MKYVATLITVEDIERSRKFYEQILGQTVVDDFGENLSFTSGFAIHQKKHFQTLIDHKTIIPKSNSVELCFEHNDLGPLVQSIKELGLEFVHEIREQPWKQRVVRFYDYDQNLIEVGEQMEYVAFRLSKENYSIEEISKATYLDVEAVKKAIKEYS